MNPQERNARLKKLASDKAAHGQEVNRLFKLKQNENAEALIEAHVETFRQEEDELRKPGKAGGRYKSVEELETCTAIVTYYDMLLRAYRRQGKKRMKKNAAAQIFDDLEEGDLSPEECLRKINHWKAQLDELEDQYAIDAVNVVRQRVSLTGQCHPMHRLSQAQQSAAQTVEIPDKTPQVVSIEQTPDSVREFVREAHSQLGLRVPKYA